MKKLTALLLAILIAAAIFAACSPENEKKQNSGKESETSAATLTDSGKEAATDAEGNIVVDPSQSGGTGDPTVSDGGSGNADGGNSGSGGSGNNGGGSADSGKTVSQAGDEPLEEEIPRVIVDIPDDSEVIDLPIL